MNRSPLEAGNSRLWKSLLVGRDDISWAGASAGDRGFCFGTEDGDVFLTNFKGLQYGETIVNAAFDDSPEAINGVAFNDGRMVATTRSGSAIWKYAEGKASKRKAGRIGEGSHGVVAALNGAFFLSLNIGGIMSVHENLPSHYSTFVSNSKARDLNIYRTASLATLEGSQVVAVAARSGGVAVGLYKPGCIMGLTAREMPNADFIDICPASYTGFPSSAFALTRDSHVLAFSNVVDVHKPTTISYGGHAGVAYRILSAGEFVCILTSKALHVIHNLVAHSPGSFRVNTRTKSIMFLLDAIDMNLVGQRWLLILLANCVLRLDLQELARDLASEFDEEVSEIIDVWPNATFKNRQLDSHKSEIALVK